MNRACTQPCENASGVETNNPATTARSAPAHGSRLSNESWRMDCFFIYNIGFECVLKIARSGDRACNCPEHRGTSGHFQDMFTHQANSQLRATDA
jgi:hypothetical protein